MITLIMLKTVVRTPTVPHGEADVVSFRDVTVRSLD